MAEGRGVWPDGPCGAGGGPWSASRSSIALGGGAALGAAVAAHRTDHAYGDYVEDAEVAELVVNPSLRSEDMDEAIRGFDGVESVHVDTLLLASVARHRVRPRSRTAAARGRVAADPGLASTVATSTSTGRPSPRAASRPASERSSSAATTAPELERVQGRPLEVGDTIDIGFFWAGIFDVGVGPERDRSSRSAWSTLRISGFGVLAERGAPRGAVPPPAADRQPGRHRSATTACDDTAELTYDEAFAALAPEDCSAHVRLLLAARRGAAPPACGRSASSSRRRPRQLNADLPSGARRNGHRVLLHLAGASGPRRGGA